MSVTKVLFRESVREQDDSVRFVDNALTLCEKLRQRCGGGDGGGVEELKKLANLLGKSHVGHLII